MSSFLLVQLADKAYYRFVVLFFNCLLSFGAYFCFDIPSVLQDQFQGNLTCPNGTVDCVLGLGMSPQEYNSLYAIHSWTNAALVMMSGFFIDKFGNAWGAFLFSSMCVLGSLLFALGSHFTGTPYLLPVMLLGRLIFGAGNGSLVVVQQRITAIWFKEKELSLAFGLTLGFSRLGSVLNFLFTQSFEEKYGIQWTLWNGVLLCVFSFLIAIIVSILDKVGMRQLGRHDVIQKESSNMRIHDIKLLPLRYWLVALTIMFYYNTVFPFIADASKFIQDKYNSYDPKEAAYVVGAVYDIPVFLTAILGILVDSLGLRGIFAVACAVLTLPLFGLLGFTDAPPLVSTVWLGVTYSFAAVCTWPCIPLVVPQATLGTAIGMTTAMYMFGNGVSNVIIGWILGTTSNAAKIPLWRWQRMMIFIFANLICCVITSVLFNIVDHRQGGIINKTRRKIKLTKTESEKKSLSKGEEEDIAKKAVQSYSTIR